MNGEVPSYLRPPYLDERHDESVDEAAAAVLLERVALELWDAGALRHFGRLVRRPPPRELLGDELPRFVSGVIYLFNYLFNCLFVCVFVCLIKFLFNYLAIKLIYLFIYLFFYRLIYFASFDKPLTAGSLMRSMSAAGCPASQMSPSCSLRSGIAGSSGSISRARHAAMYRRCASMCTLTVASTSDATTRGNAATCGRTQARAVTAVPAGATRKAGRRG